MPKNYISFQFVKTSTSNSENKIFEVMKKSFEGNLFLDVYKNIWYMLIVQRCSYHALPRTTGGKILNETSLPTCTWWRKARRSLWYWQQNIPVHPGRLIGLQYRMTRTEPKYRPCDNQVRSVVAMVSLHIHGRMTLIFRRGFPGSLSHVGTGDA